MNLLIGVLGKIQDFVKQVNKGSLADRLRRADSGYTKMRELLRKFGEGCRNVAEGGRVDTAFVQEITDLIQR